MMDMDPATERLWVKSYNAWIDRMALGEDRTIKWEDAELVETDAGREAFQFIRFRPRGTDLVGVLAFRRSSGFCPLVWIDPIDLFGYWTGGAAADCLPASLDPLNLHVFDRAMALAA